MPIEPPMWISLDGLEAIKRREGLKLVAYPDANGYSIGYGHFGVAKSETCDEDQASEWLLQDVSKAEGAINSKVNRPLKQSQFDALCSFIYNVGVGAFESSTLLKKLNDGYYMDAGQQLLRWVFSGGKENPELDARRQDELKQWEA